MQGADPTVVMADQFVRLLILWSFQAFVQAVIYSVVGVGAYRVARRLDGR